MLTKISFSRLVLLAVLLISLSWAGSAAAQAATPFLKGFGWSSTIGWVNFGTGATSPFGVAIIPPLSVPTDSNTGVLRGYAWSSNVGWIKLDPALLGPDGQGGARISSAGRVVGWGRACAIFASNCGGSLLDDYQRGGWDGWISFGTPSSNYGVTYSAAQKKLAGKAWGHLNTSWLDMNGVDFNNTPPPTPGTFSCTVNPTSVNIGQNVNWSVTAPDGGLYSYTWTFSAGDSNAHGLSTGYPIYGNTGTSVRSSAVTSYQIAGQKIATVSATNQTTGQVAQSNIQCGSTSAGGGGGVNVGGGSTCRVRVNYLYSIEPSDDKVRIGSTEMMNGSYRTVDCGEEIDLVAESAPITWSGCSTTSGQTCSLVMPANGDRTITADFSVPGLNGPRVTSFSANPRQLAYTNPSNYPVCTQVNLASRLTLTAANTPQSIELSLPATSLTSRSSCLGSTGQSQTCPSDVLSGKIYVNNFFSSVIDKNTKPRIDPASFSSGQGVKIVLCVRERGAPAVYDNSPYNGNHSVNVLAKACNVDGACEPSGMLLTNPLSLYIEDNRRQ